MNGSRLDVQSGALYSGRERYIGYSIVRYDVDTGHSAVHQMAYSDSRRVFHPAEQLTERGIFYPNNAARSFWWQQSKAIDRSSLTQWIASELLERADIDLNEGLGDRRISDVFVAPPLRLIETAAPDPDTADIPEEKEKPLSFDEFCSSNFGAIAYGPAEYGKTTLLRQMALHILRNQQSLKQPTVPVIICFSDISKGRDPIERLIRASIGEVPGSTATQLLVEGLMVVMVDDVVFGDQNKYQILKEFVARFPLNRFVFTSLMPEASRFRAVVDPGLPIVLQSVFIKRMTRGSMRSLVTKWDARGQFDREDILNRVVREIVRINVPLTAVNGTRLLSIFETQTNFRPINRAVLIETFIEALLDKGSLRSIERRTFDFTNQKHLLSHIAAWMAKSEQYALSRRAMRDLAQEYLDNLGLSNDAERIVEYFLSARVLEVRYDDTVGFRYRSFQEYFIASQMQLDPRFREWVLVPERYLSFTNEIQYYSGINRADEDLLLVIGERFEAIRRSVISEMTWSPDLSALDGFIVPNDDVGEHTLIQDYERQVGAPPLTQDEKDSVLEGDLPIDDRPQQEVYRPRAKDVGQALVLGLMLYSGVIKNLELIPDGLKRAHLARALDAWGLFLMASLQAVPALAKHRRLKLNGVLYQVSMPRHFKEPEVARMIYSGMPASVASLIFNSLGTEKLEKQLMQPDLAETEEPGIVSFFRTCLNADLKLGPWWRGFGSFAKHFKRSRYLRFALLWKMRDLHIMGEIPAVGTTEFKHDLADMIADLRGSNRKDRTKIATREFQRLTKQDFMRRIRATDSD